MNINQAELKLLKLLKDINHFYVDKCLDSVETCKLSCLHDKVLFVLFLKSYQTSTAMSQISEYDEELLMLARTIFENYINAKYILKNDSEKMAKLFLNFGKMSSINLLIKMSPASSSKKLLLRLKMLQSERVAETKSFEITSQYNWSCKTLKYMAESVGCLDEYDITYNLCSMSIHSCSVNLKRYILPEVEKNDQLKILSKLISINNNLMMLELVSEHFNLGLENDIKDFANVKKSIVDTLSFK
ncbi:MAG: DUF5677 domain-containing protein [Candidatus Berkelbacteria bacterium]|nr:DUF5677 domain-containing protein [Candidatus Berkelbacteria bacterium]